MTCPFRKTVGSKEAECVQDCALRQTDGACAINAIANSLRANQKAKRANEPKGKVK